MMGITLFADLTDEEFTSTYLTQINLPDEDLEILPVHPRLGAPDTLDWR